jgi:hypothetical protein
MARQSRIGVLPLWEQLAEYYLQTHAVMMYALLPTMQGANAQLLNRAIDEMVKYYQKKPAKLGEELRWLGILLRRANIVPLEEKRLIEERLSMYDELIENDPKMKRMRAESEARGLRDAIVSFVEARFPSLLPLARKRVARLKKPDALRSLLKSAYGASDENAMRLLLETKAA